MPARFDLRNTQLSGNAGNGVSVDNSTYSSACSCNNPLLSSAFALRSSRSAAKGGSMNTISNFSALAFSFVANQVRESSHTVRCPLACNRDRLWRMACNATGDFSTKQTCRAPRERASMPQAPLPANRSRQAARGNASCSQLNRVSRTRSAVGRSPSTSGNCNLRLRHCPAMMRRLFCGRVLRVFMGILLFTLRVSVTA